MAAAKHPARRSLRTSQTQKPSGRQTLLLFVMVPAAVGLLLIIAAVCGAVVWDSTQQQVMMGFFYILFSFVVSNAIQKQWKLVAGWTVLGSAVWLAVNQSAMEAKLASAALIALGIGLLSSEFLRRRQQYLDNNRKG